LVTALFSGQFISPLLAVPLMREFPGNGQVFSIFGVGALCIGAALWLFCGTMQRRTIMCTALAAR
jgi:hypothetical protein